MSVCGLDGVVGVAVRTVIKCATVQYNLSLLHVLMTNCVCVCEGPERFVLTSPGGSAQLWFPWRTRASFEANEADWLSPSAGSGSQTAPGGWTPDNPVNQRGREEGGGGGGTKDDSDKFHTPVKCHSLSRFPPAN